MIFYINMLCSISAGVICRHFIAAWLPTLKGVWWIFFVPFEKLIRWLGHSPSNAKKHKVTYFSSSVGVVTTGLVLDFYDTAAPDIVLIYPLVDFRSCLQLAKSVSQNPSTFSQPRGPICSSSVFVVSFMYRKTRLTNICKPTGNIGSQTNRKVHRTSKCRGNFILHKESQQSIALSIWFSVGADTSSHSCKLNLLTTLNVNADWQIFKLGLFRAQAIPNLSQIFVSPQSSISNRLKNSCFTGVTKSIDDPAMSKSSTKRLPYITLIPSRLKKKTGSYLQLKNLSSTQR